MLDQADPTQATHWLLLPVVGAAIGWFTNMLAVRMLFRPRRPLGVGWLKIQGLLPKRRQEFARNIGETVAEHLVSPEDIKELLADPAVRERMEGLLRDEVEVFFTEKLATSVPMLAPFMKGSVVDKVKATLVEALSGLLVKEAGVLGEALDEHLDLRQIVERKILDFDLGQLEHLVLRVAKRELRSIEALGAVLGFLVGVGQLFLLRLL